MSSIPRKYSWFSIAALGLLCLLAWFPPAARAQATDIMQVASPVPTNSAPVRMNLSPGEQARLAEQAYADGHYADAARMYERLADQAPFDWRVLYNLGTAYAREGQRGLAIWRYLQALRLAPRSHEIRNNLAVLGYERNAMLPFPLQQLYAGFTGNEWATLAGVMTLLCLGLLTASRLTARGRARRVWLRQGALACGLIAVVSWPFAFGHFYQEELSHQAVVVAENSVMRTGPSASQISTYGLSPGSVVRIRERRADGWLKITFGTGYVGYIEADQVRYL